MLRDFNKNDRPKKLSVFNCLTEPVKQEITHEERRKKNKLTRGQKRRLKWKKKFEMKNRRHRRRIVPKDYKAYIKSVLWRKRKFAYYKTHKKECVVCRSDHRISLHHMTYERLGDELDSDLVSLCWGCHANYHEQHGVQGDSIEKTMKFIVDEQEAEELREIAKNL